VFTFRLVVIVWLIVCWWVLKYLMYLSNQLHPQQLVSCTRHFSFPSTFEQVESFTVVSRYFSGNNFDNLLIYCFYSLLESSASQDEISKNDASDVVRSPVIMQQIDARIMRWTNRSGKLLQVITYHHNPRHFSISLPHFYCCISHFSFLFFFFIVLLYKHVRVKCLASLFLLK
jgi:hypothetical protein